MSRNPKFDKALLIMKELHDKKNQDYSAGGPYDNFEIVAMATGLPTEMTFLVQIANKVARLNSLYAQGKVPEYESVEDTWKDLAVYSTMGYSYVLEDENED